MKLKLIFIILIILIQSCAINSKHELSSAKPSDKTKVLNFGTFHFGYTPDATKTEFDEENKELQKEVREISKMIAKFKPTIICIENLPKNNNEINTAYHKFLNNSLELNTKYGESSMIGFDVGKISGVKKVYGIDNRMDYNYNIGNYIESEPKLKNSIDSKAYLEYIKTPFKDYPKLSELNKNYDKLSLIDKLKFINHPKVLDYAININADVLFYVGINDGFEGADEAVKFYHRNMKIYSNLNRIPMTKDDRIFILMGSAHTAFLREFINRSSKFEMVNTFDYLK